MSFLALFQSLKLLNDLFSLSGLGEYTIYDESCMIIISPNYMDFYKKKSETGAGR